MSQVFCPLCKKNGESEEFYTNHTLRDKNERITCPILKRYTCPHCNQTGVHTASYCPRFSGRRHFRNKNNSSTPLADKEDRRNAQNVNWFRNKATGRWRGARGNQVDGKKRITVDNSLNSSYASGNSSSSFSAGSSSFANDTGANSSSLMQTPSPASDRRDILRGSPIPARNTPGIELNPKLFDLMLNLVSRVSASQRVPFFQLMGYNLARLEIVQGLAMRAEELIVKEFNR